MQAVHILGDKRELLPLAGKDAPESGQREMTSVRRALGDIAPSLVIPPADQFRVTGKCFGRGEIGWIALRPKARLRVTKRGHAAFSGDASAGENRDVVGRAEQFLKLVVGDEHG